MTEAFSCRRWNDSSLVYNARSGDVHTLSSQHVALLTELSSQPVSPERLPVYRQLRPVDNAEQLGDDELMEIITTYREQFAQAGLLT